MYKVIDEGPNHVTLQHPMGHEVKIAKSALSKGMLKTVQKFARGGEINYGASQNNTLDEQKLNGFKAAFNNAPDSNPKLEQSKVENLAPKVVQKFADGTPEGGVPEPVPTSVDDTPTTTPAPTPEAPSQAPSDDADDAAHIDILGSVGHAIKNVFKNVDSNKLGHALLSGGMPQAWQPSQGAAPAPDQSGAAPGQNPSFSNVALQQQPASQDNSMQDMTEAQRSGLDTQMAGIRGEATAIGNLGTAQADILKQQAEAAKTAGDKFQKDLTEIQGEGDKFQNELMDSKNNINPNHYFSQLSPLGKASTFFGLILGGIGGGGKSNMALDFLNQQIARDIEAQKAELGKRENLLNFNMKKYANTDMAFKATQLNQTEIYEAKFKQMAAQAQGPLAQARAQIQLGPIEQQKKMLAAQLAAMQGGGIQQKPSLFVQNFLPKEQKEAAFKEIGNFEQAEKLRKDLKESYDDLNKKFLAGKFSPEDRKSAINAFAGILGTVTEHRFNLEESQKQIGAVMPASFESEQTRLNKLRRQNQLIDANTSFPILGKSGYNILRPGNTFNSTGTKIPSTPMFKQAAMTK